MSSGSPATRRQRRTSHGFIVDDIYEFEAPRYFDFTANMKDSGSIAPDQSDIDKEWFEISHSPSVSQITPRRPVKLYYSSSSARSSARKPNNKSSDPSSSTVIPASISPRRRNSTRSSRTSSSWKNIPSPLRNGDGTEVDDCDALLAQLGLSPMPKPAGILKTAASLKATSAAPKTSHMSPTSRRAKNKTPSPKKRMQRPSGAVRPSPLRHIVDAANRTAHNPRDSLYKRLFEMKPSKRGTMAFSSTACATSAKWKAAATISAKLKVGPDMLPSRSVKPLTIPREFNFATDQRLKRVHPSTAEEPAKKIKAVVKTQVSRMAIRPPTKPMSPKFTKRIRPHPPAVILPQKKPLVEKPAKAPTAVTRPQPKVTIPHSPKFTLLRARKPVEAPTSAPAFLATPFKARAAPKFSKPFQPIRPHNHTTPAEIKLPGDRLTEARKLRASQAETPKKPAVPFHKPAPVSRPAVVATAPPQLKRVTIPRAPNLSTSTRGRQPMQC